MKLIYIKAIESVVRKTLKTSVKLVSFIFPEFLFRSHMKALVHETPVDKKKAADVAVG